MAGMYYVFKFYVFKYYVFKQILSLHVIKLIFNVRLFEQNFPTSIVCHQMTA